MPVNNTKKAFRRIQVGREATAGTEVAAARVIRTLGLTWGDPGSWRNYIPAYSLGYMSKNQSAGEITRKGTVGRIETDLSFEDAPLWFNTAFENQNTGLEQTGGQADYLRTYQVNPTTGDPAPHSVTLECRFGGGGTDFDRTATMCYGTGIEISAAQNDDATKVAWDFVARTPNNNALTAALTPPATFDMIAALDWKLYINDTFGAIGTTNIATTLKSFTWKWDGGITPSLMMGDGRLDMADYRYGPRFAGLTMETELNSTLLNSATGERAKYEAGAIRYIRLEALGSQIGTGLTKRIRLDGAYIYTDNGFGNLGPESEGHDTVSLSLESVRDSDTYDVNATIVNNVGPTFLA